MPERLEVLSQFVGRVHRISRLPVDAEGHVQVVQHALPQLAPLVLQQGLGRRPILVGQVAGVTAEPLAGQDVLQHDQVAQVPLGAELEERREPTDRPRSVRMRLAELFESAQVVLRRAAGLVEREIHDELPVAPAGLQRRFGQRPDVPEDDLGTAVPCAAK